MKGKPSLVVGDYMVDVVVSSSSPTWSLWQAGGAGTLLRAMQYAGHRASAVGACLDDELGRYLGTSLPDASDLIAPKAKGGMSMLRVHVVTGGRCTTLRYDTPLSTVFNPFEEKLASGYGGAVVVADFGKRPYPVVGPGLSDRLWIPLIMSKRYLYDWIPSAVLVTSASDPLAGEAGGLVNPAVLRRLAVSISKARNGPAVVTGGMAGAAASVAGTVYLVSAPSVRVGLEVGAGDWLAGILAARAIQGEGLDLGLLTDAVLEASQSVASVAVGRAVPPIGVGPA